VVVVQAGKSATITATFTTPRNYNEKYLPIYSGSIKITTVNEQHKVVYLGQPYSRFNAQYILNGTDFLGERTPQLANHAGIIDVIGTFNLSDNQSWDFPRLSAIVLQPHENARMELVPYNTSFVPDYYGYKFSGTNPYGVPTSALPLIYPKMKLETFAGAQIFGIGTAYPYQSNPTIYGFTVYGDVFLGNGEQALLPAGDYRALIRILRFGGDESKKESWESWLSPVIRIRV
jgi:hypothetical protein